MPPVFVRFIMDFLSTVSMVLRRRAPDCNEIGCRDRGGCVKRRQMIGRTDNQAAISPQFL